MKLSEIPRRIEWRYKKILYSMPITWWIPRIRAVLPGLSTELIKNIHQDIDAIRRGLVGRYAGNPIGKLAHVLPAYLAARERGDDAVYAHVEIGVLFGGSILGKLAALRHARRTRQTVFGVDPLEGFYGTSVDPLTGLEVCEETVRKNLAASGEASGNVVLIRRLSSDETAIKTISKYKVMTVFIDGDHTFAGVEKDWISYAPLIEPGGFALFDNYHDSAWPDVTWFCDGLLAALPSGWRACGALGGVLILQRTLEGETNREEREPRAP